MTNDDADRKKIWTSLGTNMVSFVFFWFICNAIILCGIGELNTSYKMRVGGGLDTTLRVDVCLEKKALNIALRYERQCVFFFSKKFLSFSL